MKSKDVNGLEENEMQLKVRRPQFEVADEICTTL